MEIILIVATVLSLVLSIFSLILMYSSHNDMLETKTIITDMKQKVSDMDIKFNDINLTVNDIYNIIAFNNPPSNQMNTGYFLPSNTNGNGSFSSGKSDTQQIFKSLDGKYSGTTLDELLNKMKNDPSYHQLFDTMKDKFQDKETDDDIDDIEEEEWKKPPEEN